MSALTKLFVVLLVIVSMLNAAAEIVFINKVQPLKAQLDSAKELSDAAKAQQMAALNEAQRAADARDQQVAENAEAAKQYTAIVSSTESNLNQAKVEQAQLKAAQADSQANINTLGSSLSLLTATASKLQDQVTDLRKNNDTLTARAEDDSRRIAELTLLTETQAQKLNDVTEQLQQAKEDKQKLADALQHLGQNPDDLLHGNTAYGPSAPAINGIVSDKSIINGNTYVTISVGSADGVAKGMQFYVIDHATGQFLGMVKVDTVDSNDAIGLLKGDADKVAQVRVNDDVKTQLRGS